VQERVESYLAGRKSAPELLCTLVGAYDPYSDTDVMVSVRFTDLVAGGQIFVHPGFFNATRLFPGAMLGAANTTHTASLSNPLFDYSFQTDFAPGVACAPDRSVFPYNCILAWNDRMVPNGRIHYTYLLPRERKWSGRVARDGLDTQRDTDCLTCLRRVLRRDLLAGVETLDEPAEGRLEPEQWQLCELDEHAEHQSDVHCRSPEFCLRPDEQLNWWPHHLDRGG
jgi:hypothetical protein